MNQPKPNDDSLTKAGKPRQRAPGGGAKALGRDISLGRASQQTHDLLKEIKELRKLRSLSEAVEVAAQIAAEVLRKGKAGD